MHVASSEVFKKTSVFTFFPAVVTVWSKRQVIVVEFVVCSLKHKYFNISKDL